MNELEKLLRKASKRDRERILSMLKQLREGKTQGLQYQKLKESNFYKVRFGKYRIIFSFTKTKAIHIEAIRLRSEKTYR
jgi:mRNA-degrading endonuclease RelE of RelBE toxin-antitoxin system